MSLSISSARSTPTTLPPFDFDLSAHPLPPPLSLSRSLESSRGAGLAPALNLGALWTRSPLVEAGGAGEGAGWGGTEVEGELVMPRAYKR